MLYSAEGRSTQWMSLEALLCIIFKDDYSCQTSGFIFFAHTFQLLTELLNSAKDGWKPYR